jgi:predicted acyl esterase
MQVVNEFPRPVREIENVFIELADGCRLAARIWLPADAEGHPVPAILEYLPYRKRDGTSQRDALTHPYVAGHGYACVRVDMRGNGESDGLMLDEYTEQEQDDALEVIDWIARQPWCTGAVGMIGISWGGFNGLQVAARRPPALKAVITLCSTDDRYADDIHFMGGCLLNDKLSWASTMFAYSSRPPDPALLGERWRELWLHRLERTVLLIEKWLHHQRRDRQWQHGSVCENFAAIQCPVYAVGGWADGYSNAIPRLLAGLNVPRKGLIGPWAHRYPHFATPGPQIGFLQECLRWWDQWLKGVDTGIMDEPMYRVWMQESVPPQAQYDQRPGRWVAEPSWPSPNIAAQKYALAPGRLTSLPSPSSAVSASGSASSPPSSFSSQAGSSLSPSGLTRGSTVPARDEPGWLAVDARVDPRVEPEGRSGHDSERGVDAEIAIRTPQFLGTAAGSWCGFGANADAPWDQRADDGMAVCFDTGPLAERLEILGAPVLALEVSSDRPNAFLCARLCDVAPDGASLRVTYGLLNLTHRDSHEHPEPLEPGGRHPVRLQLNGIAHAFPPGHRIRLALSTAYWPIAWPSPEPATLTVFTAGSRLSLPARAPRPEEERALRPFPAAEAAPPEARTVLRPGGFERIFSYDVATDTMTYTSIADSGAQRIEAIGLELEEIARKVYRIRSDDPLSADNVIHWTTRRGRDDWQVRVETRTRMRATREDFLIDAELDAYEGERRAFSRNWHSKIPRDLV